MQELAYLIRARYPIIVINTHEERRALAIIADIALAQGKSRHYWASTTGWSTLDDHGTPGRIPEITVLIDAIQSINSTDAQLYVMADIHPFLSDPLVVRALRDVADLIPATRKTLILISPNFNVPADLSKTIVSIDLPLPTETELTPLVADVAAGIVAAGGEAHINGDTATIVNALRGLTLVEAQRVLGKGAISNGGRLDVSVVKTILAEKRKIVKGSGVVEFVDTDLDMNHVGGLDRLKAYIAERQAAMTPAARAAGIDMPRGVLIVGVPGTGKSLVAKVATGGVMPLLRLDIGALMGSLVGESEANLRQVFALSSAMAPCVLWIDEIEKALGGQGDLDGGTSKRMLGSLLTWMQEERGGVYIVATANDVRSLRPELLRRFDDIFWVGLPTAAERAQIGSIQLDRRGHISTAFDLVALANATDGYTGAEIEKIIVKAAYAAWFASAPLDTSHLLAAVSQVVPIAKTMASEIAELTTWAEGRALPASVPPQPQAAAASSSRVAASIEL